MVFFFSFFCKRWLESVDGAPGFNIDVLHTLKMKALEDFNYKRCTLMLDAMALKQHVEYDKHRGKMVGFVEPPIGDTSDDAKEALVVMVVGLTGQWKMPIGYFFTRTMTARAQNQVVLQALELLHEANLQVVSVTMDGHASNVAMAKMLGCNLDPTNLDTSFVDPSSKRKIHIFFDSCHMLKLVRNMLDSYGIIQSENGKISWEFVKELQRLQVR